MMGWAAVRIVVAGMAAAAALGAGSAGGAGWAGVARAYHSPSVTVPTTGEVPLLEIPPGHPISTEPACPNCFI